MSFEEKEKHAIRIRKQFSYPSFYECIQYMIDDANEQKKLAKNWKTKLSTFYVYFLGYQRYIFPSKRTIDSRFVENFNQIGTQHNNVEKMFKPSNTLSLWIGVYLLIFCYFIQWCIFKSKQTFNHENFLIVINRCTNFPIVCDFSIYLF